MMAGDDLFIGPDGENLGTLRLLIGRVLDHHRAWRRAAWPDDRPEPGRARAGGGNHPAGPHPTTPAPHDLTAALEELLGRLQATYPYFHPRYAAQMIRDPAIPAVLGYLAAMLMNPNNHAWEGGPATTEMEVEVVDDLLHLVGFETGDRTAGWGHLCSGGSLANLEALWAARDTLPEGPVIFSRVSHYSWKRSAAVLRIPRTIEIEVDSQLRLDTGHLEAVLRKERPLMVVANLGTTGSGSIDPIEEILRLRERHGFHLHVDAAYGGYARACLRDPAGGLLPAGSVRSRFGIDEYVERQLLALPRADSITIDPHKHGLSPYGAGSVLYRDERKKRPLLNSAPYTYHVADRPNLGTVTLEGSRPGAAAAACWLVHRVVPLHADGLGAIVGAGMRVARLLHGRAAAAAHSRPLHRPDLDILCLVRLPHAGSNGRPALKDIQDATARVYRRLSVGVPGPAPLFLSRLNLPADLAARCLPFAIADGSEVSALRLVLMKHWLADPDRTGLFEEMAREVLEEG